MKCETCNQLLYDGDLLKCVGCLRKYHFACLNMQTAYYMGHKSELEKSWYCDGCKNITRRKPIRNDDTPIRNTFKEPIEKTPPKIDLISIDDGTKNIDLATQKSPQGNTVATINLQELSSLLDSKFANFRRIIMQDISNEIEVKMEKMFSEFCKKKIDNLTIEQETIQKKISELTQKIKNIETELSYAKDKNSLHKINHCDPNLNLKDEMYMLQEKINTEINNKKIVLYGLDEHWNESHLQIIDRINYAFYDILSIDINGYIETVSRIGKKGYRRPIVIELISKRMADYIIQNATYFKNTGLYVSKILSKAELEQKLTLKLKLQEARRNGHHATIRHNQLYVDGKIFREVPVNKSILSCKDTNSEEENKTQTIENISMNNQRTTQSEISFRN